MGKAKKRTSLTAKPFLDIWHAPCWIAYLNGLLDSLTKNYSFSTVEDGSRELVTSKFIDKRLKQLEMFCLRTENKYKTHYRKTVADGLNLVAQHERILARLSTDIISEERRRWQERSISRQLIEIAGELLRAEDDIRILTEYRKDIYEKQFASYAHGFNRNTKGYRMNVRTNTAVASLAPDVSKMVGRKNCFGTFPILNYVEHSLRVDLIHEK